MFRILIQKHLLESLRNFFYNPKTNRAYSKGKTVFKFVLTGVFLAALIGVIVYFIGIRQAGTLIGAKLDWVYFAYIGLFGLFAGVTGTFAIASASLYEAKDNEMLLAMPIPPRTILAARLFSVWMMAFLITMVLTVPGFVSYLIISGFTFGKLIGGILFCILIGLIATIISCVIGWIIAQLNYILKNKKILQPIFSAVLLVGFFAVNTNITTQLGEITANTEGAAEKLTQSYRFLKLFGQVGTGDFLSIVIIFGGTLLICGLLIFVLSKSFYKLALGNGSAAKTAYKEEKVKDRSAFSALLGKESRRFFGNFNYLLNCGLGSLFILIVGGVFCFFSANGTLPALTQIGLLAKYDALIPMGAFTLLAVSACLNFMVVPSVSLEGKNFWILRSMPVKTKDILWSKILFQILVTGIPTLIADAAIIVGLLIGNSVRILDFVFILILPLAFEIFTAIGGMVLGLLMPNLTWTNEAVPIKQSMGTFIAIVVGIILAAVLAAGYFLIGYKIGGYLYMGLIVLILAVLSVGTALWVNHPGVNTFEHL